MQYFISLLQYCDNDIIWYQTLRSMWYHAVLHPDHTTVIFIDEHYKVMEAYEQKFLVLSLKDGPATEPCV